MNKPSLSGLRARPPVIHQTVAKQTSDYWHKDGKRTDPTKNLGEVVVARTTRRMYDVVTPNFKKRSAAGEIFNNPMYRITEKYKYPLINLKGETDIWHRNTFVQQPLPPPLLSYEDKEFSNASKNAITDAYAKVSANEGNTLLWIGELKESIAMLLDIGKGIRALYEKTKEQRIRWAKGKLSVEEAQQLTLQLLYGILPLEQQIADFLDGLFKTKQANSRQTARAFNVKNKTDYNNTHNPNGDIRNFGCDLRGFHQESMQVVVRAGVLYEIDIDDVPWLSVILDPKSVVSTAYALARLSFVIDWFVNVGGTLAAWSPSFGVNELSAWVTVEVIHTRSGRFVATKNSVYSNEGAGDYMQEVVEKWRVPISRSELPVLPPLNINLDIEKVLALVLLFAKIKK